VTGEANDPICRSINVVVCLNLPPGCVDDVLVGELEREDASLGLEFAITHKQNLKWLCVIGDSSSTSWSCWIRFRSPCGRTCAEVENRMNNRQSSLKSCQRAATSHKYAHLAYLEDHVPQI